MILYNMKDEKLSLVDSKPFAIEKEIQSLVENNTEELFGLRLVGSEFSIDNFRFDSVCFDEESKSFVIIEYKKGHSFSIIDQGFSYLSTMLQNKSDFILEYNEVVGKILKKNEIDWSQSKIIFISPSFSPHQVNSINFKDMPFELWEIKRYLNDMISLNQYVSSSNESIKVLSKTPIISNVNKEIKTNDIKDLLKNSSKEVKDLWEKINQKINKSDFERTKFIDRKYYRRFAYENNATICYINFKKNNIKIDIMGGTIFGDGSKGKNYLELDDYKNLTKKIENVWEGYETKHGKREGEKDTMNYYYEFVIEIDSNLNYLIELLMQKYESIIRN